MAHDFFPELSLLLSIVLSLFLPSAHGERRNERRKRANVLLLLAASPRYHFETREYAIYRRRRRHSFAPFAHHPLLVSPATHVDDVVIFRWKIRHRYVISPHEYITGLPEQYTRECITPTHNPPVASPTHPPIQPASHPRLTGDCDLRYRKLLSSARPKTPGGCIKFLNSGMTARLLDAVCCRRRKDTRKDAR